jgi:CBS domain containing-hemolysin-like protein
MSHTEGEVEADERRQIKNLLSLSDTSAESVMTPRVNVEFASLDMTIDETCEFFMNSSHSRLPICGQTTDDVDFFITFRDAYRFKNEGHGSTQLSSLRLDKIMKVPLTQSLDDLFEKFQKSRKHIALVLDEHGGTSGVVTMEDVLEEVFGDIKDEKDQEAVYIQRKNEHTIDVVGSVLIDDILEEFNMEAESLGIPSEYIGEPVSYVILSEEEEFPTVGSEVVFSGANGRLTLNVTHLDGTVIEKISCRLS